jgi:leucyl-tRNA synthetase
MRQLALEQDAVRDALTGKTIRKVIFVPNRLINIVAG